MFANKVIRAGERAQLFVGTASLMLIIVSVTLGVFFRYVLRRPLTWPEELSTLLFIWLAFMGASVAAAREEHIIVDTLVSKMSPRTANLVRTGIDLLVVAFTALTATAALFLLPRLGIHRSVALRIPRVVYYLPVLISSTYLCFLHVVRVIRGFQRHRAMKTGSEHG